MRSRAWPRGSVMAGARAARTAPAGRWRPEREDVTGRERPALIAAEAAGQMRRPAAEDRRHVDAAGNGQVRPRSARADADPEPRSARHPERRVRRDQVIADGDDEVGATQGDRPVLLELELGPAQGDLERRRRWFIADERVGGPMCARVHRARDRHAAFLPAPAAAVLHGGQQSWSDDVQRATCHGILFTGAGAPPSAANLRSTPSLGSPVLARGRGRRRWHRTGTRTDADTCARISMSSLRCGRRRVALVYSEGSMG